MLKIIACRALATRVLAVAVEGGIDDWAAYIDAVPGNSHDAEAAKVAKDGNKLSRKLAEVIFSDLDMTKYRD
jgi:hypothetical protein